MITLPDPGDIQVATGVPAVEDFRVVLRHTLKLRGRIATRRSQYDETRRRVSNDTPRGREIRAREYRRYRELADEGDEAEVLMHDLEKRARRAAPEAVERLKLSVVSYSRRLRTELENDRERLHR